MTTSESLPKFDDSLVFYKFSKPNLVLAEAAQEVGFRAFLNSLPRTQEEVSHMFDHRPERIHGMTSLLFKRMEQVSRAGTFSGVLAVMKGARLVPIGYGFAGDNVSGSYLKRHYKKHQFEKGRGLKVYPELTQLNVWPEMQGLGVGSAMLYEILGSFKPEQHPTAYVFGENYETLEWFDRRRFEPTGMEMKSYFGEDARQVEEWRLQAPSVEEVRVNLREEHHLPPYEVIEV